MERARVIKDFLSHYGFAEADSQPMAADFSTRRYLRLLRSDQKRAILLDSDPGAQISSFVEVDRHLEGLGLSVPGIYGVNCDHGLILMEDFGEHNIGALVDRGADPTPYYLKATDVLFHLHTHFDLESPFASNLPQFTTDRFITQSEILLDQVLTEKVGQPIDDATRHSYRRMWREVLAPFENLPRSILLRDYMLDNLMDLPKRQGYRSIGVLDFQDAGIGPIAYDLASLLEEVRRQGGRKYHERVLNHYCSKPGATLSFDQLQEACIVFSAQRHCRVWAILERQIKAGRSERLPFLNFTLAHLNHNKSHPALRPLTDWMEDHGLPLLD